MTRRLVALCLALSLECALAALSSNFGQLELTLLYWVALAGALCAAFLLLRPAPTEPAPPPAPHLIWLAIHAASVGLLFSATAPSNLVGSTLAVTASACLAAGPLPFLRDAFHRSWRLLTLAAIASAAGCGLYFAVERLQAPAARLTFVIVRRLLAPYSEISSSSPIKCAWARPASPSSWHPPAPELSGSRFSFVFSFAGVSHYTIKFNSAAPSLSCRRACSCNT